MQIVSCGDMKGQWLYSGQIRKTISKCHLLKFLPSTQSVNKNCSWFDWLNQNREFVDLHVNPDDVGQVRVCLIFVNYILIKDMVTDTNELIDSAF